MVTFDSFTFDGFESGDGTGGTGNWSDNWTFSGDCAPSSYDPWWAHEGSYYLRLSGDNNDDPGDGYAQRQVDLSGTTGSGPYLYFWARVNSLQYNDYVEVRVSTDGEDWNTLKTFTYQDVSLQYNQYWYNLSGYDRPSTFYVSFKMSGDNYWDMIYIDDVEFSTYQGGEEDEWPLPPFDPSVTTVPSYPPDSPDLHQELKWDFEDAVYDDVNFEYGQTRTMRFKAQAALEEGTYCNRIWVSSVDGWPVDDEGAVISGTTAKIIVGEPEETNCDGGKLKIEKVSDPPIVEPYEETTVTYTITIENVDTEAIPIYTIEDWLPATGSKLQEEGFIYKDNSTTARIIHRLSVAYDGFESGSGTGGTGNWTDNWTLQGDCTVYNDIYWAHNGMYHLRLLGDNDANPGDGYARRRVDLSDYPNAELQFWAKLSDFEDGDEAEVKVSTDGEYWDTLRTFIDGEDDGMYHPYTLDLSGYAGSPTVYIAFDAAGLDRTGYPHPNYDYFYIDDIEFVDPTAEIEIPVCMPDVNDGPWQFFYEDWEYDWPYFEYRWSITWDFGNYPDENDSVWDEGGFCQTFEYVPYYSPALVLYPGEILEIVFQATGTLTYSGSYYNEVFVKILEGHGYYEDQWLYSGQTGTIIVPQYDLEAETLNTVLRANAMLGPYGHWWRSWHWWRHW